LHITSLANPRVKQVARLQSQSRQRRSEGLFCIEAERELERALAAGFELVDLYVHEDASAPPCGRDAVDVIRVSEAVLAKMTYRQNPQDFVAVFKARHAAWDDLPRVDVPLYVVCSGLEKPGNIGAILRSASGAGADAVLIDDADADLFNPNTIRASTGAVFSMPIVCDEPAAMIEQLRGRGVKLVAAAPDGSVVYSEADLAGPTALVLGAEAEGLSGAWRDAADVCVTIPMWGAVDSLNVSVTAAVLLFEAARQRRRIRED